LICHLIACLCYNFPKGDKKHTWTDYIIEAKRCLATNGYLLIAETTKSLKGRLSKLRDVLREQGFEIYTDEERGDFTFIETRELASIITWYDEILIHS
jgi:hypothetical protein